VPRGIEIEPVTAWLVQNVEDLTPPLEFELIAAGGSNLTYSVRDVAQLLEIAARSATELG